MAEEPTDQAPSLAARLGGTHVSLRKDLEVSRHVFRNEPCYVVTDPMTFSSHRVTPEDYRVMVRLVDTRPLSDIWADLVADDTFAAEDEERFFSFVIHLHKLNFLSLPIADHNMLYDRHMARRQAERKKWFMAPFFLPVPLWNPDRFLDRTIHVARIAFTRLFFVLWLGLIAVASLVLFRNWGDFQIQMGETFSLANLPFVSINLVVLKIIHEFGHAYACKRFGGKVPEMGVFLIVFVPCAYVDASASWGFSKKSERLIVCLAGMYFELTMAALAVFVWAMTDGTLVNAVAHNVILLASIVTIGFNVNPLMRFDGYYAFSDVIEVPNLRERATGYASSVARFLTLGQRDPKNWGSFSHRAFLLGFGIAAAIYKVTLVLGISAGIASKFFFAGLFLAGFYVGMELFKIAGKVARSLWGARETASGRIRAAVAFAILVLALPVSLFMMPLPGRVVAPAVISAECETTLRAEADGFIGSVHVRPGDVVESSAAILSLRDPEIEPRILAARAGLEASRLRMRAARAIDRVVALQEEERLEHHRRILESAERDQRLLEVAAGDGGLVLSAPDDREVGRYVTAGEALVTLATGRLVVRTLLTQDDVARIRPTVGQRVRFRASERSERAYRGAVLRLRQSANRSIDIPSLDQSGSGDVPVNPLTGEATQPYVEVTIVLDDADGLRLRNGMTGRVRFDAAPETVAQTLKRSVLLLKNRLASDS